MSDFGARETLDLHIATSAQLFNSIDPAPVRQRDLDPAVAAYIIEWAEELPVNAVLVIAVHIDDPLPGGRDGERISHGLAANFRQLAAGKRREVSQLFRDGRISLVIGLVFVALAIFVGESISAFVRDAYSARLVADSAVIGAWVALSHPINIFLFEWWPLRRRALLYDRLSRAEVRLIGS